MTAKRPFFPTSREGKIFRRGHFRAAVVAGASLLALSIAAPAQEAPPPDAAAVTPPPDIPPEAEAPPEPPLQPGEAVHTRFSGVMRDDAGRAIIDPQGIVASILGLDTPGKARGAHWKDEPQRALITAAQVGQVFGIAIDNATPPNIYLTATSAFGLHRDATGWMEGMWGPGGGPGSIWKLNGANNYQPELFATVTLDGRQNTGAALGNIAFDAAHRQLFASDLETGMIHRFDMDGNELGRFDHGQQGRTGFLDVATGRREALAPVPFDPASAARVEACEQGEFSKTPACWNYADFRRRVAGLAVRTGADGKARLYYAVWGSEGFGNPQWDGAGAEAANSVWSVGLTADGDFNADDVRREFITPDFLVRGAQRPGSGLSHAVMDIAFPACGAQTKMAIAERGMVRNLGLAAKKAFAWPHESRVLRYLLDSDGKWRSAGRHDVGFRERRDIPRLRANAAGGVSFGHAYRDGRLDLSRPDGTLWMSGDSLCSPEGPCLNPATGKRDDASQVHGITGTPVNIIDEVLPPAAHTPAATPATPPRGPLASIMIDSDIDVDAEGTPIAAELARDDTTRPGDVEAFQACTGGPPPQQTGATIPPLPPLELTPPPVAPPAAPPPPPPVHGLRASHNTYASSGHFRTRSWHAAARSWHWRSRSWHQRSLSWHWRSRSWHYRAASWHNASRSWHWRAGSWHTAAKSWHARNRSWHTRGRSWHARNRSWHALGRSWHDKGRSWHAKGLSWHVKGKTFHARPRSWHTKGRSWHYRAFSWHRKGLSYHDRGRSAHVRGRSWHKPALSWHFRSRSWHTLKRSWHLTGRSYHQAGRSWHAKARSWHIKGRSFHLKGRTFHAKPRSWHVKGRSWHIKGKSWGHVKERSFHQRNRSWHVKGRTFHAKPRSWHVKGRSFHLKQKSWGEPGHVKGRSYHRKGRSWHVKGRTFHAKPRSWHVKGRSFHLKEKSWGEPGHVKGRSYHRKGRSWHVKGRTFHAKPRSWHVKGRSFHLKQKSWGGHDRAHSLHRKGGSRVEPLHVKGRTYHKKPRSWHAKGRSWHVKGRSWGGPSHVKGRTFHAKPRSWHVKGRSWHVREKSWNAPPTRRPAHATARSRNQGAHDRLRSLREQGPLRIR